MIEKRKCKTVSLRMGTEEERIMDEMQARYNIYNRSEILRLALKNMESEGKINVLPKLCRVCSAVNDILENSSVDEIVKNNLREELNAAWLQLS